MEKCTISELKEIAKRFGIRGYSGLKKAELVTMLAGRVPRKPKLESPSLTPKLDGVLRALTDGRGYFRLSFMPEFLSQGDATNLFNFFDNNYDWSNSKRCNYTFGDDGLEYKIDFYGKTVVRKTLKWNDPLLKMRDALSEVTGETYTVCVVQRYPSGKVGIKPHRDREMKKGTTICGVSVGATRTLTMEGFERRVRVALTPGSLYIFHPPTNDNYSHCIETDDTTTPRISFTFRNY